jgi:hypothetical protein
MKVRILLEAPFRSMKLTVKGEWHFWVKMIYETVKSGAIEQATRRIATAGSPLQNLLLKFIPDKIRKYRRDHLLYSNEKSLRRLADEKRDHKDFIYYILRNNEAKHLLSKDEIMVNSALFMLVNNSYAINQLANNFPQCCGQRDNGIIFGWVDKLAHAPSTCL